MKITAALVLFASLSYSSPKVYVCNSENAIAYHLVSNCRGLSPCKHEVVRMTKTEAQDKRLKLCGWED